MSQDRRGQEVELDYPIKVSGVETSTVFMRRPTVRDEIAVEKSKDSQGMKAAKLIANLCELDLDTVLDMDAADFNRLEDAYAGFRKGSQSKTSDGES